MSKYNTGNLFGGDEVEGNRPGRIIRVAFESGVDSVFDYCLEDALWPVEIGQRVEVPFGRGNKPTIGFCVEIVKQGQAKKSRAFKLKYVKKVVDGASLVDSQLMELARWISDYYFCPLGQVLAAMVPAAVKKGAGVTTKKCIYLLNKEPGDKVKSDKQKLIVSILKEKEAFDEKNSVRRMDVMTEGQIATAGPFNNLAKKGIIKIITRQFFRTLPVVPENLRIRSGKIVLNAEQQAAMAKIHQQIESNQFGVTLLYGVTDSGKTELYIRAIEKIVKHGKTAIVLLPEIALTAQTIERFSRRFERIAVMHSQLTAGQRNIQWQKINRSEADVVIGARSAVFAPVDKLGLIVVDEEHEPSYKQDTAPRYHGRDVAIKRAQLAGAHCVLGSATPSLETLVNCRSKQHYKNVQLKKRVMDLPMPVMKLVDMSSEATKGGISLISDELESQLKNVLDRKEQAILLLNRRGYSNFIFCASCRHTIRCRNCDVTLTFHKRSGDFNAKDTVGGPHMSFGYAICHYCLAKTLVPRKCVLCGRGMTMIGIGSQRLEEELAEKLGQARVSRVDSDSMEGKDYYQMLRSFADGQVNILAGTQMLAKGLHFPNVTLVGIISADTSLSLPDFRANERTFQLISQVAGRAGRSQKKGLVIVQTFVPQQAAIQFAIKHDYAGFVKAELQGRQKCNLPPYGRMAIVRMRDTKFEKLEAAGNAIRARIDEIVANRRLKLTVRGPMAATISRIQRYHRIQIIIQATDVKAIQKLLATIRVSAPIRPAVKIAIDVDPINLL